MIYPCRILFPTLGEKFNRSASKFVESDVLKIYYLLYIV